MNGMETVTCACGRWFARRYGDAEPTRCSRCRGESPKRSPSERPEAQADATFEAGYQAGIERGQAMALAEWDRCERLADLLTVEMVRRVLKACTSDARLIARWEKVLLAVRQTRRQLPTPQRKATELLEIATRVGVQLFRHSEDLYLRGECPASLLSALRRYPAALWAILPDGVPAQGDQLLGRCNVRRSEVVNAP